jgi:hypothetical protein
VDHDDAVEMLRQIAVASKSEGCELWAFEMARS